MAAIIDVLFSEKEIDVRIRELAKQIDADYAGREVTLLCTLKGACFFACELAKRLVVPVFMEYIQVASYEGMSSTGTITMKLDVPAEVIAGKHVIIIEDVIDTGRTLSRIKEMMLARNPATLAVCSLLGKRGRRAVPLMGELHASDIGVHYIGFTIDNEFVVGYGLDWNQKYRNLPCIGIVR
ncbi:MAG: hypoxanthine phosphoribosyltransferase [Methanocalculaceae archaeon]|jgi:hypoxanthine phosphoribosyltransferase|nr:hypoxanthine phosphoribosyltransferase [Methanocalculaceae archaeon]